MRVLCYSLLTLLAYSCIWHAVSQETTEELVELQQQNLPDEELADGYTVEDWEAIAGYIKQPLDLNTASRHELEALFFLQAYQIDQLLSHREALGPFSSLLELQGIPSFDAQTIQMLLPYVRIGPGNALNQLRARKGLVKGYMMLSYQRQLELARGYQISDPKRLKYLGSPDRVAIRLRQQLLPHVQFSLQAKKDAGEPFARYGLKGFDHYSTSVFAKEIGPFKKMVMGDYHMQIGQGLSLWTGASYHGSGVLGRAIRVGAGLRPHSGLMESRFLRGAAFTWEKGDFSVSPFVSFHRLTARVDAAGDAPIVRSIQYSGLHRTATELRNRKALRQSLWGALGQWESKGFRLGLSYVGTRLQYPLVPQDRPYLAGRFRGKQLHQVGLHSHYSWKNLFFFGEAAHALGAGRAWQLGLLAALGPSWSASWSYRSYDPDYQHFYAQGYRQQASLANEQGLQLSLSFHPSRKWEWHSSLDLQQYPAPRFRARFPSRGWQAYSQVRYIWYKKGYLSLRAQWRKGEENFVAILQREEELAAMQKRQLRFHAQYKVSPAWEFLQRLEVLHFQKEGQAQQWGRLIYQEWQWTSSSKRWRTGFRLAYFHADSYQARLFAYERDVLYAFSFPFFYQEGFRFYLNQRWVWNKRLSVWFKYGLSHYVGLTEVGTGLDATYGNQRNTLKLQIRYQW